MNIFRKHLMPPEVNFTQISAILSTTPIKADRHGDSFHHIYSSHCYRPQMPLIYNQFLITLYGTMCFICWDRAATVNGEMSMWAIFRWAHTQPHRNEAGECNWICPALSTECVIACASDARRCQWHARFSTMSMNPWTNWWHQFSEKTIDNENNNEISEISGQLSFDSTVLTQSTRPRA